MSLPALSPFSPLASVLNDVQRSIDAKLYYPALLVALTIPEVCAGLALDRDIFVKSKQYTAFVDTYGNQAGLGCDGETCYRLRGGVIHRASMAAHPRFQATHVIFTLPESPLKINSITIKSGAKSALTFDLVAFCTAMVKAAYAWYEDHQSDPKVAANMKNVLRYCANGIAPFVVGQPIVASGE